MVVILIISAAVLITLVDARQDPSLQVPAGHVTAAPATESDGIPVAPPFDPDE